MNTSTRYQVEQLTLNLDRPQYSICPKCDSKVIRLADGCDVCGWRENQSPSVVAFSIPCTVKQPNQPERKGLIKQDLGDRFLVEIPDSESTVTVPKLYVYPDFPKQNPKTVTPPSKIPPPNPEEKKATVLATYIVEPLLEGVISIKNLTIVIATNLANSALNISGGDC